MKFRRATGMGTLVLAALLFQAPANDAKASFNRPCPYPAEPPYAAVGAAPNVLTWQTGDPPGPLKPASCSIWNTWHSTLLVALAGSFSFGGDVSDLLRRFGDISTLRGVKYWSITDGRWRTLILDASALEGPDERRRRGDFSPAEMQTGRVLYFEEKDNRSSGTVIYRAQVEEVSADRVVLAIQNVTAVWLYLLRLFDPGDLQSLYILRRLSPEVWGLYILTGVRTGSLTSSQPAHYVNRAVAIYRHILGVPTDRDPPVRP